MKFKQRVSPLDLADTVLTVYLHNPSVQVFDVYVRKNESFEKVGSLFSDPTATFTDAEKQDIWDVVTMVADLIDVNERRPLTMDEAMQLSMMDCACIAKAMGIMTENALNPTPAAATTQEVTEPLT